MRPRELLFSLTVLQKTDALTFSQEKLKAVFEKADVVTLAKYVITTCIPLLSRS